MHHDVRLPVHSSRYRHGRPRVGKTLRRNRKLEYARRKVHQREGAVVIRGDDLRVAVRCVFDGEPRIRNASAGGAGNCAGEGPYGDLGIQLSQRQNTKEES